MAVYAVGDIQGCYAEFRALLDRIEFDEQKDKLWLTGDLVNRGPENLAVLRFVRGLGDRAVCVLGNHDLHLLAVACGARSRASGDTLEDVLSAPDGPELLDWLRRRPLLHRDRDLDWVMVHAGLAPQWDIAMAERCARELEARLRSDDYVKLLKKLFRTQPDKWEDDLQGIERLRITTNCLTRLRYCRPDGGIVMKHSGAPGTQPDGLLPWFRVPGRASRGARIVFGHWSTLGGATFAGKPRGESINSQIAAHDQVLPLDGGCVWGGELLAARLDGETVLSSVACEAWQQPEA